MKWYFSKKQFRIWRTFVFVMIFVLFCQIISQLRTNNSQPLSSCSAQTSRNDDQFRQSSVRKFISFSAPNRGNERKTSYYDTAQKKLVIKDPIISRNFFNYSIKNETNKLEISIPSNIILNTPKKNILVNDKYIDRIEFKKGDRNCMKSIVLAGKDGTCFDVSTTKNMDELVVDLKTKNEQTEKNIDLDKLKNNTVVIDPGHGGIDKGAVKDKLYESDLNLDIAKRLYNKLKSVDINAKLTRSDDRTIVLRKRAEIANREKADLFISIHNNAGFSSENGSMVLFNPYTNNEANGTTLTNEKFAQIIQQELVSNLGTENLGLWKRPNILVLSKVKMPAALAEIGYITNSKERENLLKDDFKEKAAEALYNSTLKALNYIK